MSSGIFFLTVDNWPLIFFAFLHFLCISDGRFYFSSTFLEALDHAIDILSHCAQEENYKKLLDVTGFKHQPAS